MSRLQHTHGCLLVIRTGEQRSMRYFDVQDIIAPNFPGILYHGWGVRSGRTVHCEQYSQFLMGERKFRPHDLLNMRYKVSYAVYGHSFGRSWYNDQVGGCKPVKREHSLSWGCINQDKVV